MNFNQKIFQLLKKRKIGIFGGGVSSTGLCLLLKRLGVDYTIYDQNPEKGEIFDQKKAENHDIIVTSPSFVSDHEWVKLAESCGRECITELDFASLYCPAKIVAVTGTNGKTTITSFLTKYFQSEGRRSFSAGNIGDPLSKVLAENELTAEDTIFCEISSFQAERLRLMPLAGLIWSNFSSNHLDVHKSLDRYFAAKYNLINRLKEPGFYCGESVSEWANLLGFKLPIWTKICSIDNETVKNTAFEIYPQRENFSLIVHFCKNEGLRLESVQSFAKSFSLPRYRLEKMCTLNSNTYWNDSKCTNFDSLEKALKNFPEKVIWIGGGRSKGGNLAEILPIVRAHVQVAILVGEVGQELEVLLKNNGVEAVYVKKLGNAVNFINNACFFNKNIVFSPAFSSFDQFKNFIERGKYFEKCIFDLKNLHC